MVNKNPVIKTFWLILGIVSLVMSIFGLILPIVPTLPFLFLASACFYRSSEFFYKKVNLIILKNKKMQTFLSNKIGIFRLKVTLLFFLWGLILIYGYLLDNLYYSLGLLVSATASSIILLSFKEKNNTDH